MDRYVFPDKSDPPDTAVLSIRAGGTGAKDKEGAAVNLRGIRTASIDKPNGIAGLDENSKVRKTVLRVNTPGGLLALDPVTKTIPPALLPELDTVSPTVSGPVEMYIGETAVFEITNADIAQSYSAVPLSGSVAISGDKISYTAGGTPGVSGFMLNGRKIKTNILSKGFGTPSFQLPVNGAVLDSGGVVLSITGYTIIGNANIKDDQSRWQFSVDPNFSVLVADVVATGVTNSYLFRDSKAGMKYYVRARYESLTGLVSGWTPVITFTTRQISLSGPTESFVNKANTFTILNYVSTAVYSLDAFGGSVTRTGNTLTYVTPATQGQYGFKINGQMFPLSVMSDGVVTPVIISPLAGANNLSDRISIFTSSFSVSNGTDRHISTTFQLSTDPNFNSVVAQTADDTVNLTSWQVGNLTPGTAYYIRLRYKALGYGYSKWSDVRTVYTKSSFTPSLELGWLTPSNSSLVHSYGNSTAITGDGNTLVVADKRRAKSDMSGNYESCVYVYSLVNGLYTESNLIYPNAYLGNNHSPVSFGQSLDISSDGTMLVIGYPESYNGAGCVVVLKRSSGVWLLDSVISAPSMSPNYGFGTLVKISGDGNTVVVKPSINDSFKLYRRQSTGIWQNTLNLTNPNAGNCSINYLGDIFISTTVGSKNIRQHMLQGSTWSEKPNITPSKLGLAYTGFFGTSINQSENGRFIVVSDTGLDKGVVLCLTQTDLGWSESLLRSPAFGTPVAFGSSISISGTGDTLLVADEDEIRTISGVSRSTGSVSVYVKKAGTYIYDSDLTASEIPMLANSAIDVPIKYGKAIAVNRNGARAVVTASGTKSGTAFVYA